MLTWSVRKKIIYILIAFFVVGFIFLTPIAFHFYKKPQTCFDNVRNQNEINTDCGGMCEKICREEIVTPSPIFERYIKVAPGVYNAIVLVENINDGFHAVDVPYEMKFYDKDNVLIAEIEGTTFISKKESFPIIEYGIETQESEVDRMTFEFMDEIKWARKEISNPKFEILEKNFFNEKGVSKLEGQFKNNEIFTLKDVSLVAILYDKSLNVITASHTKLDAKAKGTTPFIFTWNEQFMVEPYRIDIIARFLPQ